MEQLPTITDDDMQRIEHALKQQINAGDALRQELRDLVSTQVAEELIEERASISTAVKTAEEAKATAASTALKSEKISSELNKQFDELHENIEALSARIEQYIFDSARPDGEQLALVNRQMAQLQKRMYIAIIMFIAVLLISILFVLLRK